jgi:mycothiol system anti-sigma-R factor
MSNTCDHCFDHVYDYLDRELGWLGRWRVNRHLRKCLGCKNAYVFEEKFLFLVKSNLREDMPPELMERLRRAIGNES